MNATLHEQLMKELIGEVVSQDNKSEQKQDNKKGEELNDTGAKKAITSSNN